MENATKALIMVASVILGVMIISVGVALFTSFAGYSEDAQEEIAEKQIIEFNNQFEKYYNGLKKGDSQGEPILVTAHEIVSLANRAKENNTYYDLLDEQGYGETKFYIQIDVKNGNQTTYNFEKKTLNEYTTFLSNNSIIVNTTNTKYFYCIDLKISKETKKVMYLNFVNYN